MMQPRFLPLEMWYAVADELARWRDFDTLKSCSLACRTLRRVSQRRLFSGLTLRIDLNVYARDKSLKLPMSRLHDVLSSNPALSRYVQSFKLEGVFPYKLNVDDGRAALEDDVKSLPMVLAKLSNIKAIVLKDFYSSVFPMQIIANAFAAVAKHPNLRSLEISQVNHLALSFLSSFPNITNLDLFKVQFGPSEIVEELEANSATPSLTRLDSLSVQYTWDLDLLNQLSLLYDLHHLRELHVHHCGHRMPVRLAQLCSGSSVEHLSLDINLQSVPDLNLNRLASLFIGDPGPFFVGSIQSLPFPDRLTRLTIMISFLFPSEILEQHSLRALFILNMILPTLTSLRAITIEANKPFRRSRHDIAAYIPNAKRRNIHITYTAYVR